MKILGNPGDESFTAIKGRRRHRLLSRIPAAIVGEFVPSLQGIHSAHASIFQANANRHGLGHTQRIRWEVLAG